MKKSEVVINGVYGAIVSGKLVKVRLMSVSLYGGWNALNLTTDCVVRIRSAQRLRCIHDGCQCEVGRAARAITPPGSRYRVLLSSVGNPDFGQYAPVSEAKAVDAATIADARKACEAYIAENNLGGGNWANGRVIDNRTGKLVGHFSYNLRFWEGEPGTWTSATKELAV